MGNELIFYVIKKPYFCFGNGSGNGYRACFGDVTGGGCGNGDFSGYGDGRNDDRGHGQGFGFDDGNGRSRKLSVD